MAPIIWTSRNQTRLFAETQYFARKRGRTLNRGQTGKAFNTVDCVHINIIINHFHGGQSSSNYRISMMFTCARVVTAPNNPGQVEILITPGLVLILVSCGHRTPEAVTAIGVQTRDRIIIIIIVVVCREKERFCTMTVTVRQGVGALNARADYLVSREMILDLESWNNSDNVFLGAAPAD